jgi:hypothetical protein
MKKKRSRNKLANQTVSDKESNLHLAAPHKIVVVDPPSAFRTFLPTSALPSNPLNDW